MVGGGDGGGGGGAYGAGAGAEAGGGAMGVEILVLLEGGAAGWARANEALGALWAGVREPWLVRALLHYHARTASARALHVLARAPEPHARHLLDALADGLRAEGAQRRAALAALAPLVARRPAWLPRLAAHPAHPLPRELLRAARTEREPLPLLHALLALAALVPAAPALAAPHWPELAEALLRPAALRPPPPAATRAHLQLAQLALFHALYATHPCTLLDTLRAELANAGAGGGGVRDTWERALQPLLASVRLHPALVTGSRAREADAARRLEEHEIVAEARRLTLHTPHTPERRAPPSPAPAPATAPPPHLTSPRPRAPRPLAGAGGRLRPGTEPWFALAERCGTDSAPHTPLPPDMDPAEPPEAAVEATPENTPAKETRAAFRFPSESSAVRAIGRRAVSARAASPPARNEASPPAPTPHEGGGGGGRLARVMAERRALESPVVFAAGGGVPPAGALRPEPRAASAEDQEVVALTARWAAAEAAEDAPPAAPPDPRRAAPAARAPRPAAGARARAPAAPRPPRRAASQPPRGSRSASVAVQTVDTWPQPYEFLIADFYRNIRDDTFTQEEGGAGAGAGVAPCERLDAYLSALYSGQLAGAAGGPTGGGEMAEQLALTHAQLVYERWRREAHAERNRRLLGRVRHARALELHNAALQDRVRALTKENGELRDRLARPPPPSASAGGGDERLDRLEAALQEERAARARAEARGAEAAVARDAAHGALQRARGEAGEAARHAEALGRAARQAERRSEHVRRLRQELLVLAEREARLLAADRPPPAGTGTPRAPPPPAPLERALRAALARAEGEALAGAARAEAAAARAHELEAALAARDAALGELRRGARAAAEEGAAQLGALRARYEALLRVLRAAEGQRLERLAAADTPPAPAAPRADKSAAPLDTS